LTDNIQGATTNTGLRVLILDQGRQALPFLKALSKAGHEVIIVCNTRFSEGYFSKYPAKRLLWPSYVDDRKSFESKLFDYLRNNRVDVTISVGDITSDILSKNKEEIVKYTCITQPDYPVFVKAADKLNLMQYCMSNELPCPKTYDLNPETVGRIEELLNFPVIVKPTRGVGAVGLVRFEEPSGLVNQYNFLKKKYGNLIVQEYIAQENGMQYQAEAFMDEDSRMKVCMVIEKPRFFPVSGGTSSANVTVYHPEITEISRTLLEGLHWKGAADIDFILDPGDNRVKILEINPRVTAGIKIAFAAGIDFADLHLKLARGERIPEFSGYKTGVYCRNFFLEVLWYIYSDRKMKKNTSPPFFKFFGHDIVDQLFSRDDPFTALGFFLHMLKKYMNLSRLKSKIHK
jgi:predicted ATP-grasp superfamily ATP-dependent carboligase